MTIPVPPYAAGDSVRAASSDPASNIILTSVLRLILVAAGLAVGSILGLLIAMFTGLIDVSC